MKLLADGLVVDTRAELETLVQRQRDIRHTLANLERQIHAFEGNYLGDTACYGNVVRGWFGIDPAKRTPDYKLVKKHRIFSNSSVTAEAAVKEKESAAVAALPSEDTVGRPKVESGEGRDGGETRLEGEGTEKVTKRKLAFSPGQTSTTSSKCDEERGKEDEQLESDKDVKTTDDAKSGDDLDDDNEQEAASSPSQNKSSLSKRGRKRKFRRYY